MYQVHLKFFIHFIYLHQFWRKCQNLAEKMLSVNLIWNAWDIELGNKVTLQSCRKVSQELVFLVLFQPQWGPNTGNLLTLDADTVAVFRSWNKTGDEVLNEEPMSKHIVSGGWAEGRQLSLTLQWPAPLTHPLINTNTPPHWQVTSWFRWSL